MISCRTSNKFIMKIDKTLISRIETLAKLKLSEEEKEELADDLSNILNMVEKLQEVDTEGIEPLVYMTDEVNKLRPDQVENMVTQPEALKNAPDSDGTYFKTPRVL